jgi:hypothetical protein
VKLSCTPGAEVFCAVTDQVVLLAGPVSPLIGAEENTLRPLWSES